MQQISLVLLSLLAISACSTLQPHVDVPPNPAPESEAPLAGGLNVQFARARLLEQRYLNAVSNQTLVTNLLAGMTIPLAAAAVAVGITNPGATATRNLMTGGGAGTAAALGLGAFLVDRRRDVLYYNGARQIICLRVAYASLVTPTDEYSRRQNDVARLGVILGEAAAAGVGRDLLESGLQTYAAGHSLLRQISSSGPAFADELERINIIVNAQLASQDRTLADVATAVVAVQKLPTSMPVPVTGRTQSGQLLSGSFGVEPRLRREIAVVRAWLVAHRVTSATALTRGRNVGCALATTAGPLDALAPSPTSDEMDPFGTRESDAKSNSGTGNPSGVARPPPPSIARPASPSVPTKPADAADISIEEMRELRAVFGLTLTNAAFPNSPRFMASIRRFQVCKGHPVTGWLTDAEKRAARSGTDACLPAAAPNPPTSPAPAGIPVGPQPAPPNLLPAAPR